MRQVFGIVFALFVCIVVAQPAAAFTARPAAVHCGKITNFRLIADDTAIEWRWDEIGYGPKPKLAEGETYAVVTVQLGKLRSVGKFDFALDGINCVAIAKESQPYDPETWQIVFEDRDLNINLLFKVPVLKEEVYTMSARLTTREKTLMLSENDSIEIEELMEDRVEKADAARAGKEAEAAAEDAAAPDEGEGAAADKGDADKADDADSVPEIPDR